jgi:hypothetical protein
MLSDGPQYDAGLAFEVNHADESPWLPQDDAALRPDPPKPESLDGRHSHQQHKKLTRKLRQVIVFL